MKRRSRAASERCRGGEERGGGTVDEREHDQRDHQGDPEDEEDAGYLDRRRVDVHREAGPTRMEAHACGYPARVDPVSRTPTKPIDYAALSAGYGALTGALLIAARS